jgi:tetratricopeptide (TPR) repeat protein
VLIVPVVDHVFHNVGAAAVRHFVEEITGLHGAARGEFTAEEATIRSSLNRVGQVGQHAAQSWMCRQNCRQQNAVSTSYVHEAFPFAEIVCPSDDRAKYALAFLRADSQAMAEQDQWFAGKPEENGGLSLASDTEAYAGHLRKARGLTKLSIDSAIRADSRETGAIWQEIAAQREAAFGNLADAKQQAVEGLKLYPVSQGVQVEAALALAMSGDGTKAASLAQDLNKHYPLDTQMQSLWLPTIHAQLALNRKNPTEAISDLQTVSSIEFAQISFIANLSCLYHTYIRGEAYLAAGRGSAAAAEFQNILDHSGIVWNCWTGALARLGMARANALQARTSQGADADAARVRALAAYKDFLTLWKDADPDTPVYKAAKAEYAKLQ